jgi:copper(I)-binding protein
VTAGHAPAAARLDARSVVRDLLRSALGPVACGVVLIALLATWVLSGGGGTISRVRIEVTGAAVPAASYTAHGAAGRNALAYLSIRNLTGTPDELLGVTSPDAARVVLTLRPSAAGTPPAAVVAVPAGRSVGLSPFGPGLVLIRPAPLTVGQQVILRLRFRRAGLVTVAAVVTPPGTP